MSEMSDREICLCTVSRVVDVIARKWSLFALNIIGKSERLRFNQIMDQLSGVSPTTLAETLDQLVTHGLIRRNTYPEIPPRVEYSLTAEGIGLRDALRPLMLWAIRKDPASARDPKCPPFARVPLLC